MYFHELTFATNQEFPIPNPAGVGNDHFMLLTNTEFLTLAFYSTQADSDLEYWNLGPMACGLFTSPQTVPVVLLTFLDEAASFCHPLNMYRLIGDERQPWLKSDKDTVSVMLIDADTGILRSIRQIQVNWAGVIRRVASHQLEIYGSAEQVEITAQGLLERVPLDAMFRVAGDLNWLCIQSLQIKPKANVSDN